MYSFHSSKAKEVEDHRKLDPRNQVEVPLSSEKELSAPSEKIKERQRDRKRGREPREPHKPAGGGGGGGGNWRETTDHYSPQDTEFVPVPQQTSLRSTTCASCAQSASSQAPRRKGCCERGALNTWPGQKMPTALTGKCRRRLLMAS